MKNNRKLLASGFLQPHKLIAKLRSKPEVYWQKRGDSRALALFHQMAVRVPAYKDFLHKHKISAQKIQTIDDFKKVPPVSKDTYLRQYPLDALAWDGKLTSQQLVIASTTGSTGEPFYFPRENDQDWQYAAMAELYLLINFQIDKKSTLYIVGFPMGQWIGGLFTYQALKYIADTRHYPLSIITPGVSAQEIIKAVKQLGPYYDQIIIGSYGPFLKDTLDEAKKDGLDWKKYNLGFIFAAEVFSESFRDYVAKTTGISNIYTHALNQYGTVDLGTMSYETPLSILARRQAYQHKPLFDQVFNKIFRVPTLTQFFPDMFYFEDDNGDLICSAYSGLPLVRYDLKDRGKVISYKAMLQNFDDHGLDLKKLAQIEKIDYTIWQLPFVYVYERRDLSVSFYAFTIYPETIRRALLRTTLETYVTGRFTMEVNCDDAHNQRLDINVELKSGIRNVKSLKQTVTDTLVEQLKIENSPYQKTYETIGNKATPNVIFWKHHHPQHFNPIIKQRWIKKT